MVSAVQVCSVTDALLPCFVKKINLPLSYVKVQLVPMTYTGTSVTVAVWCHVHVA